MYIYIYNSTFWLNLFHDDSLPHLHYTNIPVNLNANCFVNYIYILYMYIYISIHMEYFGLYDIIVN